MGAMHSYDADNYGYGLSGFMELSPTDKITLGIGATYAQNALSYLGGAMESEFEDGQDVEGFNVYAGVSYDVTQKFSLALDGAYLSLTQGAEDYSLHGVNATATYKPVSGLALSVDGGMWQDSLDNESAKIIGRIQYTF